MRGLINEKGSREIFSEGLHMINAWELLLDWTKIDKWNFGAKI